MSSLTIAIGPGQSSNTFAAIHYKRKQHMDLSKGAMSRMLGCGRQGAMFNVDFKPCVEAVSLGGRSTSFPDDFSSQTSYTHGLACLVMLV